MAMKIECAESPTYAFMDNLLPFFLGLCAGEFSFVHIAEVAEKFSDPEVCFFEMRNYLFSKNIFSVLKPEGEKTLRTVARNFSKNPCIIILQAIEALRATYLREQRLDILISDLLKEEITQC